MLWIIHGHHRFFWTLPETFPENSHPFISSRGVLSIVTHQMLGFLVFGLGAVRNDWNLHPRTMIEFFYPPPPIKGAKREIYKVPLTSGFKLGKFLFTRRPRHPQPPPSSWGRPRNPADPGGFDLWFMSPLNHKPAIFWKGFGICSVWWKTKIGTRNGR